MMRQLTMMAIGAVGFAGAAAAWTNLAPKEGASDRIVVVPAPAGTTSSAVRTAAVAAPVAPAAALVSSTYISSTDDIPNPERGFYRWAWNDLDTLTRADVDDAFANGYRLLFIRVRLDAYRSKDIPAAYLTKLTNGFNTARAGGVKLIVRAVYNYPEGETGYQNAKDAPLSRVQAHINQLKPLLQTNSDVIAFLQAGFIGAWGEWHTSSNNLTTPANRTAIKDALLAAVPTTRFVQFRYPPYLQAWAPTLPAMASALNGSFRLGFQNDCFLASQTDVGTYDEDASVRAQQQDYIARLTALTPFGGETCNPADEEGAVPRTSCQDIRNEGARYHLTYLNNEYYVDLFHNRWVRDRCMTDVRTKMGYRFELTRSSHPDAIARGGTFKLDFSVKNSGWARLYNPRGVQIVLRNTSSGVATRIAATGTDPRQWLPSETASAVSASGTVPASLPTGTYAVMLALPDADPRLADKPGYAIRFANRDNGAQGWQASLGAFATGTTLQVN